MGFTASTTQAFQYSLPYEQVFNAATSALQAVDKATLTGADINARFITFETPFTFTSYGERIVVGFIPNEQGVPDVAQRIHWDSSYARSIGLPAAYDYGMMRDCWLSHYLTDWMGDDAWLESMSSQMRKFNYLGDTHTFTGEVIGKRTEGGRHLVDVELRGTSQRGEVTCPATATIALPSRAGVAVELPDAPAEFEQLAAQMLERDAELRSERRAARNGAAS